MSSHASVLALMSRIKNITSQVGLLQDALNNYGKTQKFVQLSLTLIAITILAQFIALATLNTMVSQMQERISTLQMELNTLVDQSKVKKVNGKIAVENIGM